jgi:hypothetical protein
MAGAAHGGLGLACGGITGRLRGHAPPEAHQQAQHPSVHRFVSYGQALVFIVGSPPWRGRFFRSAYDSS